MQEKSSAKSSSDAAAAAASTAASTAASATATASDVEKGFALLRTDSIQLWVYLQGHQPLEEQPLKFLSEDISYRIRETSDVSLFFLTIQKDA